MQEMIFTENKDQRLVSLEKLRPIREDFIQLFEVMSGQPVAIRLLDPPLHEFLPKNAEQLSILAKELERNLIIFLNTVGVKGVQSYARAPWC